MAVAKRRRRPKGSGLIRQLPSGRWQAKLTGPDGVRRPAPRTFDTKLDANAWLAAELHDIEAGTWSPPATTAKRADTVASYGRDWIATRKLAPRTRVEYERVFGARIVPELGSVPLARLTAATVRRWNAAQPASTPTRNAHAYGLLHSILTTAVDEELIPANPCRIKGAGASKRVHVVRLATLDEVATMTAAFPEAYRLMVPLAVWCSPRAGELRDLRRADVDVDAGTLRVSTGVVRVSGRYEVGEPKSAAGVRTIDIPPHVLPLVVEHLDRFVQPGSDALLFPSKTDPARHMSGGTFYRLWYPARAAAGRDDLHWHDLRHTGATLTAEAGATLKELMTRIGHATPQAALIYQHAAEHRGPILAARLSELALAEDDS